MELQIFKNSKFGEIRTIVKDKEVWFVGKDVAEILGYEASRNAIAKHVDDEDKLTHQISASGQNRNMTIINESGLYALILSSKLPTAKAFKHWVTSEVLPSIRKTSGYHVNVPHITPNPHYRTRMVGTAIRDIGKTAEAMTKVFAVKPGMALAAAMEMIGNAYGIDTAPLRPLLPKEDKPGYMNPTALGKKLGGIRPSTVNIMLESAGLQRKEGKEWRLTDEGRKHGEEKPYTSHGHSGYQIVWGDSVIEPLKLFIGKE